MRDNEKLEFKNEIDGVMTVFSKNNPSKQALRFWWSALKNFPLEVVIECLDEHVQHSKFAPTPADIVAIVSSRDGRPTAEEAWATALTSNDEAETVVWTDEISQAMAMGAGDILADGDKIAARMAFRDSYTKLVQGARDDCRPVRYWVSLGHSKERRNAVIENAVVRGLISAKSSKRYLTELPKPSVVTHQIAGAIAEPDPVERASLLEKLREHL